MTQPSTPETETMKRGPGRPRKETSATDPDMPDGIPMRTVYLIHCGQGDGLDPWVSSVDWATVLKTSHVCGSFDWIVLVDGNTIVAKKSGRKIHIPWSNCKNAIELDSPLTEDEIKRGSK